MKKSQNTKKNVRADRSIRLWLDCISNRIHEGIFTNVIIISLGLVFLPEMLVCPFMVLRLLESRNFSTGNLIECFLWFISIMPFSFLGPILFIHACYHGYPKFSGYWGGGLTLYCGCCMLLFVLSPLSSFNIGAAFFVSLSIFSSMIVLIRTMCQNINKNADIYYPVFVIVFCLFYLVLCMICLKIGGLI